MIHDVITRLLEAGVKICVCVFLGIDVNNSTFVKNNIMNVNMTKILRH